MSYAKQMIDIYPPTSIDPGALAVTIDALNDCAQACAQDIDADLSERHLAEMVTCIRLCLSCADVCVATARVVSRRVADDGSFVTMLLDACAAVCKDCGDECERHAQMHAHCRVCAEACRRCEEACRSILATFEN
jgi:hypothetical protein